jgi:predicted transposase/invertase (TIGR01784 family)
MRQPDICKLFLEELLGFPIAKLEFIGKEQDISDSGNYHGIRLDVYANDANQTRYDIEMQNTNQKDLERRVRYYQSGIDRNFLVKGSDYDDLPESYVIFICDFDYYRRGYACYEWMGVIKVAKDILIEDGRHSLILNSRYQHQHANVSPAIQDFLDYIRTKDDHHPYGSELVKKAIMEVERLREDEKIGGTYMTWAMNMRDERKIGRAEGIQQGIINTIVSFVARHLVAYEDGLRESGLTEEEFRAKIAEVDPDFQK